LVHERPGERGAGADDIGQRPIDRHLLVRGAAVVGDDHPVQSILGRVRHVVGDAVAGVDAVLRVDMVVARQPDEGVWRWPIVPVDAWVAGPGWKRDAGQARTSAQGANTAQELPSAALRRTQILVRNGQVDLRRRAGVLATLIVMLVAMTSTMLVRHVRGFSLVTF